MSSELSSGDDCAEEAACDHYSFLVLSTVPDVSPGQVRLSSRCRRSGEDQARAFSPSFTHLLSTCEWSDKIPDPGELLVWPRGQTQLI